MECNNIAIWCVFMICITVILLAIGFWIFNGVMKTKDTNHEKEMINTAQETIKNREKCATSTHIDINNTGGQISFSAQFTNPPAPSPCQNEQQQDEPMKAPDNSDVTEDSGGEETE